MAGKKKKERAPTKRGNVFSSIAYAHRRQLNQKLVLPQRVKDILRRPQDEVKWSQLKLLCTAVRLEVERVEDVYMNGEEDIEKLARAVECCTSMEFGNEVGEGFPPIPAGSRLMLGGEDESKKLPIEARRKASVDLVRGATVGTPIAVKLRPMDTCRQPPLDHFGKELMKSHEKGGPPRRFATVAKGKTAQEIRDLLLIALWDAFSGCAPHAARHMPGSDTTPGVARRTPSTASPQPPRHCSSQHASIGRRTKW